MDSEENEILNESERFFSFSKAYIDATSVCGFDAVMVSRSGRGWSKR